MKRVLIVVGVVVAVIVILFSGAALHLMTFGKHDGKPQTGVRLSIQSNGVCGADATDRLGGYHNGKIKWVVQNDCGTAQYVTITGYRQRDDSDPTKLGPPDRGVVDPDQAYSSQIDPTKHEEVPGQIVKWNLSYRSDLVYKYSICVGTSAKPTTNCLDPDIDVWPF